MTGKPNTAAWPQDAVAQIGSRVLVVDDDPSFVQLLKEDLEIEGHHVSAAYDGQMGLRRALREPFDLIILDVNMPMTNGFRVFECLRGNPDTAKIPVIFVTGEVSKEVFPLIDRSPRAAHVKKPLDLESFNSLVKNFLERYPAS